MSTNPHPHFDLRYEAARNDQNVGSGLRPDELTERVRVSLDNAFAYGALWQYNRGERNEK